MTNFNSYKKDQHSFDTYTSGSTTFVSYTKPTRLFSLFINGFNAILEWFVRLSVPIITIGLTFIQRLKLTLSLTIATIGLSATDSLIKFTEKINLTITTGSITLLPTIIKMRQRFGSMTIEVPFNFTSQLFHDSFSITSACIIVPTISFSGSPTVKQYYLLTDYDSQYLSALDANLLNAMDYQEI